LMISRMIDLYTVPEHFRDTKKEYTLINLFE